MDLKLPHRNRAGGGFWYGAVAGGLFAALTAAAFYDFSPVSVALLPCILLFGVRAKRKRREKEQWEFTLAFRDMLLYFNNALAAGYSPEHSIGEAEKGMAQLLGERHRMVRELTYMRSQLATGFCMEQVFTEFAKRSGAKEAEQFAELFQVIKRTGGSLSEVIRQNILLLQEAEDLKRELRTAVAAKELEFCFMCGVPHAVLLYLKLCSPELTRSLYHTVFGISFLSVMLLLYAVLVFTGQFIIRTALCQEVSK